MVKGDDITNGDREYLGRQAVDLAAPTPDVPDDDLEGCPVQPLGRSAGTFYFFSPAGELRELTARDLTRQGLISLFDGELKWIQDKFPSFDQDGEKKPGSWSHEKVGAWLVQRCAWRGIYDASTPVRGPGVWSGDGRILVIHCGDVLLIDGTQHRVGIRRDQSLYPAAAPVPRPTLEPAGVDAGEELAGLIRLWRFNLECGPDVVLGWIGQAMLGAAPSWRAHIFATGRRGSGKTWLAQIVANALGGQGHPPRNNYTEASLRQAFNHQARAFVLDESEPGAGRVKAVIELLRHMSGIGGAQVSRGSAGGKAQAFSVNGAAWLSSIIKGALLPQDRSRITEVQLEELPKGAAASGGASAAELAIRRATELSPGLRARCAAGWGRFTDSVALYRDALLVAGCDARQADQFATLLAGRDLLLKDSLPDSDSIDEDLERFAPLIAEATRSDDEQGEGELCLDHLYSSPVDLWRSGARSTVAQIIIDALAPGGSEARRALGVIGLRVEGVRDGTPMLLVARNHVGLERLFANERWAGGGWNDALRYLEGAGAWPRPMRFGGVQQRSTAIPPAHFPSDDSGDTERGGGGAAEPDTEGL